MATVNEIFEELLENNSTNYKLEVLKKYKDHAQLQRVLRLTYDRVAFTYGVSLQNVLKFTPDEELLPISLDTALDVLENDLGTGALTGHDALRTAINCICALDAGDSNVFKKILERNIRCNVGRTQMLKVWPDLISKQVYMRCDTYGEKSKKNISFPAYIQLKADGTYREFTVNGDVTANSRSGESYEYPVHFNMMKNFEPGVYTGELTVRCTDALIEDVEKQLEVALKKGNPTEAYEEAISTYARKKAAGEEYILPRSIGNGIINSSTPPHDDIVFDVWDYITLDDYKLAANLKRIKTQCSEKVKAIKAEFDAGKISKEQFKNLTVNQKKENVVTIEANTPKTPYKARFAALLKILDGSDNIRVIEYKVVNNLKQALEQTSIWMNLGMEGGVLKNFNGIFKDGTSGDQLKLKLCIDAEMRVLDFAPGRVGSKRDGKVGAIIFGNDEGTIKGRTSGFSDELLDDMTENPEKYLGQVMTVQFNDLSQARGNDYHALSHPRFMEFRDDKDETDTLEKCFALREMAMMLEE